MTLQLHGALRFAKGVIIMKRKLRTVYLIAADIVLLTISILASFLLRFDGTVPEEFALVLQKYIISIILIKLVVLYFFKLYKSLWEYASIEEMMEIVAGVVFANIVFVAFMFFLQAKLPRSVYILTTVFDVMLLGGLRMSYRVFRRYKLFGGNFSNMFSTDKRKRIMVIGGGDAGIMTVRELKNRNFQEGEPVVIIDDDPDKRGKNINGITVEGNRSTIVATANDKNIDEIIIAMPSASRKEIKGIIEECKKTDCKLKILPGVYELIDGNVNISKIREVQIEDLLGREEIHLDTDNINDFLTGKTVMVTGGAGSIGSELARQIARFHPEKLILLDINENGLYAIQQELKWTYNKEETTLDFEAKMGSIRDADRLNHLFRKYKPEVVFHAAAHKHVPLMEDSPHEAIKNNVFGTLNLVRTADKYKVEKFVQISTDKAVNPTNVMGATKRICEIIIRTFNTKSKTEFVAVRFGNVLGSNGSVIPLFKKQIAAGGPVTVTHPEIIRYFMTIPEASQLVLQAGAMAEGGEIFVLDMGEPVKILNLAEDLIKLSGFTPYEDMDIKFTGLRPGEKLYEELLLDGEGITKTKHRKIFIGKPYFTDMGHLTEHLDNLRDNIDNRNGKNLRTILKTLVPEYKPENQGKVDNIVKFKNNSKIVAK
jgi:FlaA1/EpsC-like NDP-sugar epimerase